MDEEENSEIHIVVKRYHLDIKKEQLKLMHGQGLPWQKLPDTFKARVIVYNDRNNKTNEIRRQCCFTLKKIKLFFEEISSE